MKKQNLMEIAVGIFVLLGLGTVFVMVMSIADQQHLFVETYRLNATFRNVSGLKAGAPVFLSGVEAGTVESISFTDAGWVQVGLLLRLDYSRRIKSDSVATIGSVGLLGDKSVEISMGSQQAKVLAPEENLKTQDQASLSELVDGFGVVRDKLENVLDNLVKITGALVDDRAVLVKALEEATGVLEAVNSGQGSMGKLLRDKSLYDSLVVMVRDGDRTVQALGKAADKAVPLVAEISEAARNIRESSKEYPEIARSASRLLATSNEAMEKFSGFAEDLKTASKDLPQVMDSVKNTMTNVEEASRELPATLRSARSAADEAGRVIDAAKGNWFLKGAFPETGNPAPMEVEGR